jgi:hypothetical protein
MNVVSRASRQDRAQAAAGSGVAETFSVALQRLLELLLGVSRERRLEHLAPVYLLNASMARSEVTFLTTRNRAEVPGLTISRTCC